MKEKLLLVIKGMIIGVANIIPGVSGGTLAITLGIYERLIKIISNLKKELKKNLSFIIPLGLGAVMAVLILSKIIDFTLEKYPLPTFLFFIGLIIGGIPLLYKKIQHKKKDISNMIVFLITFGIVLLMALGGHSNNVVDFANAGVFIYPALFLVGSIAAATMIIPGVSGSFVLMLLGFYKPIINTISNLVSLNNVIANILLLIPFGLGIIIGIVVVAKLIEFLLKKYEVKTYYGILGFVFASIFTLSKPLFALPITTVEVIIGLILLITGGIIAYKLGGK